MLLKIDLPLFIELPRKTKKNKRIYLNQNIFRNLHHRSINEAKHKYKDIVEILVKNHLPMPEGKLLFTYTLFPKSKRRMDLSNSLSAIQKFTDDALSELGIIEDDDYTVVAEVNYRFGCVDPINPRCELVIERL
jgi:Holliday junction resolvase RusA-like endonuclease